MCWKSLETASSIFTVWQQIGNFWSQFILAWLFTACLNRFFWRRHSSLGSFVRLAMFEFSQPFRGQPFNRSQTIWLDQNGYYDWAYVQYDMLIGSKGREEEEMQKEVGTWEIWWECTFRYKSSWSFAWLHFVFWIDRTQPAWLTAVPDGKHFVKR